MPVCHQPRQYTCLTGEELRNAEATSLLEAAAQLSLIPSHPSSALTVPVQGPLEEDNHLGMTLGWPRVGLLLCSSWYFCLLGLSLKVPFPGVSG